MIQNLAGWSLSGLFVWDKTWGERRDLNPRRPAAYAQQAVLVLSLKRP